MPLVIKGATSGAATLAPPAVAGTTAITLPGQTVDLSTLGASWTSYTPTIGGGTWALGDGSVSARYALIGKTVFFKGVITWGASSVYSASSALTVTLPVATQVTAGVMVNAHYNDAGVNRYLGFARATSSTVIQFQVIGTAGLVSSLISTAPFTWGTGDQVFFAGMGEAQ